MENINNMPPEILLKVFQELFSSYTSWNELLFQNARNGDFRSMSQVCRLWHDMILNSPIAPGSGSVYRFTKKDTEESAKPRFFVRRPSEENVWIPAY